MQVHEKSSSLLIGHRVRSDKGQPMTTIIDY